MTFPTVPTVANQRIIANVAATTNATRNFPTITGLTKNNGDLLIAIVIAYQTSATANAAFSGWTAGWTEFADRSSPTGMAVGMAYRWVDGSETTPSVTQAATITGHAVVMVLSIEGAHATTPPEASALSQGTTSAPGVPSLNPTNWDVEDTLWIAVGGFGETATTGSFNGPSGPVPGMTDLYLSTLSGDVVGGVYGAVCFAQAALAVRSSGSPFAGVDLSNARNAVMQIAVRPAQPTISQAAYRLYADGTESGSTALAAQDTAITADLSSGDANLGLRVRLQEGNTGLVDNATDFELQWEKNASGAWNQVSTLPSIAEYVEDTGAPSFFLTDDGQARGQSFIGTGIPVTRADFRLKRNGTPPFSLVSRIYAHTGTFGSTGVATGAPLATSAAVDPNTIPTTATWTSFTFDGTFIPTAGTAYVVVAEVVGTGGVASANDVQIYVTASAVIASNGVQRNNSGSAWTAQATNETLFALYGAATSVIPYDSTNLTDGDTTTSRLTGGTGTFSAGKVIEDGLLSNFGFGVGAHTELLYSLTVKAADVADTDVLRFRVLRNGAALGTYAVTPTITVTKGAPPATALMGVGIPI